MKRLLVKLIKKLPSGERLLSWYVQFKLNLRVRLAGSPKNFFTHIYKSNLWESDESVSGPGSTLEYTKNIRKQLPLLFREFGVSTILDAPCGDYNWFSHVERGPSVRYLGMDIVQNLVAKNQSSFGDQNTAFSVLDILTDRLPDADLWLCRDALIHFSNRDIFLTIRNFLGSNISYLLTTSYTNNERNIDIPTGSFRWLNLERPPFNFCRPEKYIDDWIAGSPVRHLCLWKREDLRQSLKDNRHFRSFVKEQTTS
ncbi:class I SAM-dependent methyltransferase [Thermodesulfobacteriota bacterium]